MLDNFSGNFNYTAHVFDRIETCDLSDDYTLPDYMPAVGRVLSCTATAAQPTLYLGAGGVECAGGLRYSLIYESADDGALFCADLPGEYDVMLTPDRDMKSSTDGSDVSGLCDASLENVTARVTAPRRLTLKSKLRLRPALRAKSNFSPLVHGAEISSESIRKLSGNASCTVCASATAIPLICRDSISRAEAGLSPEDEVRVIASHGDVMISQIQNSETSADCRGEVSISLIICREGEGERPRRIIRKIPFSTTLTFDAPLPAGARQIGIRGYGVCPSVSHTVDGDLITLEAGVLLSAEVAASAPITYVKDIYSKNADCETAHTALVIHSPASAFNAHATVSAAHDLASLGLDSGMKLCDVTAKILPDIEKELSPNGKLTLSGKMRIFAIADNGGEFIPIEYDGDFRYCADISEAVCLGESVVSAVVTVGDVKGRIDAESVVCDCEICAAVLIEEKVTISALSEANLTYASAAEDSGASILVCYPANGETLWDVAKRYRTDVASITEKNSLPTVSSPDAPDSLAKTKFLII